MLEVYDVSGYTEIWKAIRDELRANNMMEEEGSHEYGCNRCMADYIDQAIMRATSGSYITLLFSGKEKPRVDNAVTGSGTELILTYSKRAQC